MTVPLSFPPASTNSAGDYDEIADEPFHKESSQCHTTTEYDVKSFHTTNKPMTADDYGLNNTGSSNYYFTLTQVVICLNHFTNLTLSVCESKPL